MWLVVKPAPRFPLKLLKCYLGGGRKVVHTEKIDLEKLQINLFLSCKLLEFKSMLFFGAAPERRFNPLNKH